MTRHSCEASLHVILTVVKDRQGSILGFLFREKGHKIMISPIVNLVKSAHFVIF